MIGVGRVQESEIIDSQKRGDALPIGV